MANQGNGYFQAKISELIITFILFPVTSSVKIQSFILNIQRINASIRK